MSETKHTPGPWTADKRGVVAHELRRGGFRRRVALTESAALHRQEETSANARLIAASPDMLEALRACEATFTPASGSVAAGIKIDWESLAREFNRRQKIAAAAIAKAEGRS